MSTATYIWELQAQNMENINGCNLLRKAKSILHEVFHS